MPTPSSPSPPNVSPKSAFFMTNKKNTASASASKFDEDALLPTPLKALSSISDLKDLASSRLDHLKHHIDHSHSEILKDLDASQSRLHKRFKIQTQACQQVMDEAEKEYKKMFERISESREAMKSSWQMHRPVQPVRAKHPLPSFHNPMRNQWMLSGAVLGFRQLRHRLSMPLGNESS
ncbi:hypothetical protein CIPAW_11G103400 [Carya illinoinensis]|nr:hypothetical protein CIPAW_11G103400 [Carya illinoinensis]